MKLLVASNSAVVSAEARNAVTKLLEAKGWSVWHWFLDLWLIDSPEAPDFMKLRDELMAIPGLRHVMIMSTEGPLYRTGWVPTDAVPWIEEHWTPKSGIKALTQS